MFASSEVERLEVCFGWKGPTRGIFEEDTRGALQTPGTAGVFTHARHEQLYSLEDASGWFEWRNQLILNALRVVGLPSALWDIGAGNGKVGYHLQMNGVPVVAVEPGATGAAQCLRRGISEVFRCRLDELDLPLESIAAFGIFDVLEHMEDDVSAIAYMFARLQRKGLMAITVPAQRWLWSNEDLASGHQRRYSRKEVCRLLTREGFRVEYASYHFAALVVPVAVARSLPSHLHRRDSALSDGCSRLVGLGSPWKWAWLAVGWTMDVEMKLGAGGVIPFGTSILAIGRKP